MMSNNLLGAFCALAHNGRLIKEAERILQSAAENPNAYLYLVNADGTRVRIMPGMKIENFEIAKIDIYKEADNDD